MKLELGGVKQLSQVTPNRQVWKNKTTSWTSNPGLCVPLNAQSYERQEWPLPKVEPPLWILLGLSSIHSFENRVLPTGATNRSGLLSLGRAESSWRDEKAGTSLWYTSVGCGIPRDTEEGINCSPGMGDGHGEDGVGLSGQKFTTTIWKPPLSLWDLTRYVCSDH